jgi:hypothetical protein
MYTREAQDFATAFKMGFFEENKILIYVFTN